jgi:hypothetical protein
LDIELWTETIRAAAIAERTMALVMACGSKRMRDVGSASLAAVWTAVEIGALPAGKDPLREIKRLIGRGEPDEDDPTYLAEEALEAVCAVVTMAFRRHPYDGDPSSVGLNIYSELDGVIRFSADPRPRRIDPRDPPPPDRFEAEEMAEQARDSRLLASARSPGVVAASIRDRACERRAILEIRIVEAFREVGAFGRTW